MRGVCTDVLNRPPTLRQLMNLGATGVRFEIRDDPLFQSYYKHVVRGVEVALLWGPSTEFDNFPEVGYNPKMLIIGNEPDGVGDSSWTMKPQQYIDLWNRIAPTVDTGKTVLCTAGMVGGPEFLREVWPYLKPEPDYNNKHYPNNETELIDFRTEFKKPVIVGETCYETGTRQQIIDWCQVLARYANGDFYYVWGEWNHINMGLYSMSNRPKRQYWAWKEGLAS